MENSTSRRSFLRNTAIASTGLALLSTSTLSAFSNACPYDGYNPYSEEKTDLRTSFFGKHARIKGTIYNKSSGTPVSGATVEVWHLSSGSNKYRHRAKLKTDGNGDYNFVTDFPAQDGQCPKVFFKVSNGSNSIFTEVLLNDFGAYITSKHWEAHRNLGSKLIPTAKKSYDNSTINFNISI